jgi:hypothetical protein
MGQTHVRDREGNRICSLAGMDLARRDLITLIELDRGIALSLEEAQAAKDKHVVMSKAVMVLRLTKATCDAFIGLAAGLSQVALGKVAAKGAEAVEKAYGAASFGISSTQQLQEGKYLDVAIGTVRETKIGGEVFANSAAFKAELLRDALNDDQRQMFRDAVSYKADLAEIQLEMIGADRAKAMVKIGHALFDFHNEVSDIIDEHFEELDQLDVGKTSILQVGARIRRQIRELETFIASCEVQLPPALA